MKDVCLSDADVQRLREHGEVELQRPWQPIHRRHAPFHTGDRVTVLEAWRVHMYAWSTDIDYRAGGMQSCEGGATAKRAASWATQHGAFLDFPGARPDKNKPQWVSAESMPRWASRLRATVADVGEETVENKRGWRVRLTLDKAAAEK